MPAPTTLSDVIEPTPAHSFSEQSNAEVDEKLVARMIEGEAGAWREFQAKYDRLIYRCITKVTARFAARLSADDVKEIYATLLLQLLANDKHKLRTFDPQRGNRFGSWIGLLAINAAYDHLRSIRRDAHRAPLTEAEGLSVETPDPHDLCELRQRAGLVEAMMAEFSAKDRQFVELYFGEGLKPEEVAVRMQISVKTVYSKKHKIQSRLEALLGRERLAA
jgi:RNA polymerase sigma-70 factor (ECF subfamily)